jgi:hypothetical protein
MNQKTCNYNSKNMTFGADTGISKSTLTSQDYYTNFDYNYNHDFNNQAEYYNNYNYSYQNENLDTKQNSVSSNLLNNNPVKANEKIKKVQQTTNKPAAQKSQSKKENSSANTKLGNKTISSNLTAKCYKKFAVGGLINMLKEEQALSKTLSTSTNNKKTSNKSVINKCDEESDGLSEEQIIDDYYHSLQSTQNNNKTANVEKKQNPQTNTNMKQQQYISESVDLDKISSSLKTSGTAKWKNSTKQTSTSNSLFILILYYLVYVLSSI